MFKMVQKITLITLLAVIGLTSSLSAQKRVTLRELNTYEGLDTLAEIGRHPLRDSTVSFTAIISSYVKNSGLASFNSTANSIGRVHVFVVDTTAASLGRDGMAMQIVQSSGTATFETIESLPIGSIIDVTGKLTFFSNVQAQFTVDAVEDVTTKIEGAGVSLSRFDALLTPIAVNASDLNIRNSSGNVELNLANYTKYAHAYVKISNSTVQFSQEGARPNYAVKNNNQENLVLSNDISLRYRNDRTSYRTGYNARRTEDGQFTPPPAGALIDLSGYMVLNSFDPFSVVDPTNNFIFKITPMDDGIVWIGDQRNVAGQNGFVWPNDLKIIGFPPTFESYTISNATPVPAEIVTISIDILAASEGATITSHEFKYSVNGKDTVTTTMTVAGNKYSYTFPAFANNDIVTFSIKATDSGNLTGEYGPQAFLVANTITTIESVQRTAGDARADSPLNNLGDLRFNLVATVVSDSSDGLITIQQSSKPWSGVFVDARNNPAANALKHGDIVTVTKAAVIEDFGVTLLTNVELSKTGTNTQADTLIPSILTQNLTVNDNRGEAWEGMVVRFNDVKILNSQADGSNDYGEFTIGSRQGGAALDTLESSEGYRIDGSYPAFGSGVRNFSDSYNENTKVGAVLTSVTGMAYYSFSNAKMLVRKVEDFVGTDWTYPVRTITLVTPPNSTTVDLGAATTDVVIEWTPSIDQDGNAVKYLFGLATENNGTYTRVFTTLSDDAGAATKLTLTRQAIDDLLASNSVAESASITLKWTVAMTDGVDTVQTATQAGSAFTDVWYDITFKRLGTANEELGKNYSFELNQNFPNPFNPSTVIEYSIPSATKVQLSVYNIIGQRVANLVNNELSAGSYTATFNAANLSSGVYFYRLEAGNKVAIKKMLLIK